MDIVFFYGWWQLTVCFFAALALLSIWYHLGRKQSDQGQIWLAASLLCWSLLGAVELIYQRPSVKVDSGLFGLLGWRSLLSLCNSLFILLALPWFRYIPRKLEGLIRSRYWRFVIGIPFAFSLLPPLTSFFLDDRLSLLSELDVYYALFTLVFLGYVIWESFTMRKLPALAWLSTLAIVVTLAAQLFKLGEQESQQLLLSVIFKTCLIMIFFALALSWVKEIVEESSLADRLKLTLTSYRDLGSSKFILNIMGVAALPKRAELSKNQYDLLHQFFTARITEASDWLEIKPRTADRGRVYDINDHNEIKRLLAAILDGIYGVEGWSQDQEGRSWKKILFEMSPNRDRKIRLALSPSQLELGDAR